MRLLRNILLTGAVLLLSACSAVVDGDGSTTQNTNNHFINLAVSVVNGQKVMTRGVPTGGEDGDGREVGFERENAITGITLILYQSETGINDGNNPAIDFVAYYPVSRTTKDANTRIEATYETGNQLVPHNTIDFTKTYHAIVVANADLTGSITTSSKLNDVRDRTLTTIYSGNETQPAQQCVGFVMSSEQDNTLNFAASGVSSRDAAGDYYYDLTSQTLVIERMAARIDFWAVNGAYDDGITSGSHHAGYLYSVTGSTDDKFVVTGIMPFNLTNGQATYGTEYLLKRLTGSLSTVTPQWLIDETAANYVLDPKTTTKVSSGGGSNPTLLNSLESVKGLNETTFLANSYYKSVEAMHAAVQTSGTSAGYTSLTDLSKTGEDVIVAYPMENTLIPNESLLYYQATGIAIEGYYYKGGLSATPTRKVYYGYLRHQGDADSYDILTTNDTSEKSATTPMNIGVVRNNIYRIWIGSIQKEQEDIKVTLNIKVKKWDIFEHETIYM